MRVERLRVFHPEGGPQKTKLSEQDSTDVNLIMDSWIHAGAAVAGHVNPAVGRYGDFSSGIDYQTALNAVSDAQRDFATLPPKIRNHVDNDPGKLLDLVFDEDRRDECVELGLVAPEEPVRAPGNGPGDVVSDSDAVAELKALREAFKVPADWKAPVKEPEKAPDPAASLFD